MSYTIFRWHSNKEKTQNDWKGKRYWADKKNVGGKKGRASRAHGVFEEKRGEKEIKTKRKRTLYKKPI